MTCKIPNRRLAFLLDQYNHVKTQSRIFGVGDTPNRGEILFANGILASNNGWNIQAAAWAIQQGFDGQFYYYWCGAFRIGWQWKWPPIVTNNDRAKDMAAQIKAMFIKNPGQPVRVVCHSNGNEILMLALKLLKGSGILIEAHCIAAAITADFNVNGFNDALREGLLTTVHVYCSDGDDVLWFGGYPHGLGRDGPLNVADDVKSRVNPFIYRDDTMGHSTWVDGPNLKTLQMIISSPAATPAS